MRIFVSYAKEDLATAQTIDASLSNERHHVFVATRDAEAGAAYDLRIREEIEKSHVFIFLASRHSLETGRYPRTELAIAVDRFKRVPGNILPVRLGVSNEELPGSLRASTVPSQGDLAADVAFAVSKLARARRKRLRTKWLVALGVLGVLGAVGIWAYGALQAPLRSVSTESARAAATAFWLEELTARGVEEAEVLVSWPQYEATREGFTIERNWLVDTLREKMETGVQGDLLVAVWTPSEDVPVWTMFGHVHSGHGEPGLRGGATTIASSGVEPTDPAARAFSRGTSAIGSLVTLALYSGSLPSDLRAWVCSTFAPSDLSWLFAKPVDGEAIGFKLVRVRPDEQCPEVEVWIPEDLHLEGPDAIRSIGAMGTNSGADQFRLVVMHQQLPSPARMGIIWIPAAEG